jgi:putative flippase GtrA
MKKNILDFRKNILHFMEASRLPIISNPKIITMADHILTVSFIRYLIIGFTTVGLDFGIYKLLINYTSIQGLPANMTSTLLSLAFNFPMSNFWTFKAGGSAKMKKLRKYASLAVFNYIFNNVMFYVLHIVLSANDILSKVIITGMVVCWNYFLYKLWIFKSE